MALKKIVLEVGKKTIELTPTEAKELKSILCELFGKERVVEKVVEHWRENGLTITGRHSRTTQAKRVVCQISEVRLYVYHLMLEVNRNEPTHPTLNLDFNLPRAAVPDGSPGRLLVIL